jgi:hypothetical protein
MKRQLAMLTWACVTAIAYSQTSSTTKQQNKMKLNAGILTTKLAESKTFYTNHLGFGVTFENEFYLLMHTPNRESEITTFWQRLRAMRPI